MMSARLREARAKWRKAVREAEWVLKHGDIWHLAHLPYELDLAKSELTEAVAAEKKAKRKARRAKP